MKIMTIGIDLAKNVFAAHGIDEQGKAVLVGVVGARAARLWQSTGRYCSQERAHGVGAIGKGRGVCAAHLSLQASVLFTQIAAEPRPFCL